MRQHLDHGDVSIGVIAGVNAGPESDTGISKTLYMTRAWDLPNGLVLIDGDGHTWTALDDRQRPLDPRSFHGLGAGAHMNIASKLADVLDRTAPFERCSTTRVLCARNSPTVRRRQSDERDLIAWSR